MALTSVTGRLASALVRRNLIAGLLWVNWFLMKCNTSEVRGYCMLFIDCGCANGTVNCSGVCAKLGGQCPCALNVTQTCSACNCTFFGVDCDGCEGGNSVSCICSNQEV